jgi:hypothetical protein
VDLVLPFSPEPQRLMHGWILVSTLPACYNTGRGGKGICNMSFPQVCARRQVFLLLVPTSRPSAALLDVFGQEVVHIIADAVAKGVTDFPYAVESGDQTIPAVRG